MGFHRSSAILLCLLCAGLISVNIGHCRGDQQPAGKFRCCSPSLCALYLCVVFIHHVVVSILVVAFKQHEPCCFFLVAVIITAVQSRVVAISGILLLIWWGLSVCVCVLAN